MKRLLAALVLACACSEPVTDSTGDAADPPLDAGADTGCQDDSDCDAPLRCNPATGACALADKCDEYGAPTDCDPDHVTLCEDDSDCAPREQCQSVTTSYDCSCDPFTGIVGCAGAANVCLQCEPRFNSCGDDADCPDGLVCTSASTCAQCSSDTHCGDGERCHEGSCVVCVADSDCADDEACDAASGTCYDPDFCLPYEEGFCDEGVTRCTSDDECGEGAVCTPPGPRDTCECDPVTQKVACLGIGPPACRTCCTPSPEVCDGIDNDCDGIVDSGFDGSGLPMVDMPTESCNDGQVCLCDDPDGCRCIDL